MNGKNGVSLMRERLLIHTLSALLFLLPWQTIWIVEERFLGGAKMEYWTIGFYATEGLLWLAVLFFLPWYYKKWKGGPRLPFAWTPDRVFILSCGLFVLYSYLSSLWSPNPALAVQHALWIMEAFLLFFMLFLGPLPRHRAWISVAAGSIAPAILGIVQFLTQSAAGSALFGLSAHPAEAAGASIIDAGNAGRWLRAYGPYPHPNIFGGYLVVAIIALDSLALDRRYMIDDKKNIIYHISLIMISTLQWTALFFTFSRSAWLAAGVWLALLAFRRDRRYMIDDNRRIIIYRLSLIVLLITIFFPLVQTRLSGDTAAEARSKTERISGYEEAVALWKSAPLLGVGLGNYTVAAANRNPGRPAWVYQPAHHVPLLLLSELGILGAILFVGIIISSIKARTAMLPKLAVIPLLILAIFDHYLFSSYSGILLNALFY